VPNAGASRRISMTTMVEINSGLVRANNYCLCRVSRFVILLLTVVTCDLLLRQKNIFFFLN